VINVDLLSVIRGWHFRDGLSVREIARRTKLSRNTLAKYLANGEVELAYPKRNTPSKIDDYAEVLSSWLTRESGRSRKQRRNLRQLYGDLVHLGGDLHVRLIRFLEHLHLIFDPP
jgi:transcriptional regulator with XRE-family HTH domain